MSIKAKKLIETAMMAGNFRVLTCEVCDSKNVDTYRDEDDDVRIFCRTCSPYD